MRPTGSLLLPHQLLITSSCGISEAIIRGKNMWGLVVLSSLFYPLLVPHVAVLSCV